MTVHLQPLHDLNRKGHAVLVRELGVIDALRFLSQFTTGQGDYTEERDQFWGDETVEEIFQLMQEQDRHQAK